LTKRIEENMQIVITSLSFLVISTITVVLFLPHSVTDIPAQFPQLNIKDQNTLSLNVTNAVYNANTSESLGFQKYIIDPLSNHRGTLF
jgi:hypothetical protein